MFPQTSADFASLSQLASNEFMEFLQEIYEDSPDLFSENIADSRGLFAKMTTVCSAWRRLKLMRASNEKWSEADFVANVFVHHSTSHSPR